MKDDEIKEIKISKSNHSIVIIKNGVTVKEQFAIDDEILDYITNLQEENERLKEIAHKMHLWIFLHSEDEQKVYDELGLTDEENAMLGYSGQFRIGGDDNEQN